MQIILTGWNLAATQEAGFIKIWAREAGFFASPSGIQEVVLVANANQTGECSVVFPMKANYRVILVMIIESILSSNQQMNGQKTRCFYLVPESAWYKWC